MTKGRPEVEMMVWLFSELFSKINLHLYLAKSRSRRKWEVTIRDKLKSDIYGLDPFSS